MSCTSLVVGYPPFVGATFFSVFFFSAVASYPSYLSINESISSSTLCLLSLESLCLCTLLITMAYVSVAKVANNARITILYFIFFYFIKYYN